MKELTSQSIIFTATAYLFQMGLNLGMLQICLNIINNKTVNFSQLFGSFHILVPFVLATIVFLVALILVAFPGVILLLVSISFDWNNISNADIFYNWTAIISGLIIIVPVVYVSVRLQFYNYFLIDEECSIFESITKSARISKNYIWELFLLGVILSIIFFISIIPLGAGLVISIPLGSMTTGYVYLKLKSNI